MPTAVMGTAGHIDHGKSALVKALTGIDPDRLPEEKKRGITIELGYAFLDLPSGRRVSIVDVPGHERFVKTMAQGASVIQIGLLVVDSGEGVKPQTVEHLHILRSMGVRRGLVALTKCDNTAADLQELASEEAWELVKGTFLEGAPVIRTSAVTGQGLDELKGAVDALAALVGEEARRMPMRMPVDRVFSVPGFGTVVTGTLLGGKLKEGDEVAVMPSGQKVKVRGIEVHDVKLPEAWAPCRIALNLGGLEADARVKGKWIASPGFFMESANLLAVVEGMPWMKKELRLPARLSINIGSGIFQCRLFAGGGIRAGGRIVVRISLDEPIIARAMDRFILRLPGGMSGGYSTVAGGVVADPLLRSRKITGRHGEVYGRLEEMTDEDFISSALALAGRRGVSKAELFLKAPSIPAEIEKAVGKLVGSGRIARGPDQMFFDGEAFEEARKTAAQALEDFHKSKPELPGMKKDELRRGIVPPVPEQLFRLVIDFHSGKGLWKVAGDIVSRAGFSPGSDEITGRVSGKIMALLAGKPSSPPSLKEIPALTAESAENVRRAVSLLATSGRARLVGGEFLYGTDFLRSFVEGVNAFFQKNDQLRVSDLKTIIDVSRKYALPLARWLDDEGVTLRRGEVRVKKKAP